MKNQNSLFYQTVNTVVKLHSNKPKLNGDFIAKNMGVSRMTLHRRLKKQYNQNAHQYILTHRIEQAKKLLKTTEMPISQISIVVGFTNHTHFSKVFKRIVGYTPNVYRKIGY